MNDESDFEIVRRCESASPAEAEAGFRELVQRYQERVFNTALRVLGNSADAADVTQEVFFTVYRKLSEFQFSSRLFTWIYRITVNLSIDKRRRGNVLPPTISEAAGGTATLASIPDESSVTPESWTESDFIEGEGPGRDSEAQPEAALDHRAALHRGTLLRRDRRSPRVFGRDRQVALESRPLQSRIAAPSRSRRIRREG